MDGAFNLTEKIIKMDINQTFLKIKDQLGEKGCKIISEESPRQIVARQGSLWGLTPKSAQKILTFNFEGNDSGTRVTVKSKLGAGWKNLTIIGSALSAIVVGFCFWIALDLNGFLISRQTSYWSWLISEGSVVSTQIGQSLVNLMLVLAVSLTAIIVAEIVVAWYAHRKIGSFALRLLEAL